MTKGDNAAAESNPNIVKILSPGGIPCDDFLMPEFYSAEAGKEIQEAITKFLGK